MASPSPPQLSPAALRARRNRIARLAERLGFIGRIEYRHVYSGTGGASYGQAATADRDLLTVYAEAFERDANPDEFSLNAILAHERGHQLVVRHPRLAGRAPSMAPASEEILASIIGAIICGNQTDEDDITGKAIFDLIGRGVEGQMAARMVHQLKNLLESLL